MIKSCFVSFFLRITEIEGDIIVDWVRFAVLFSVVNSDILLTFDIDAKNLVTNVPIKERLSYLKERLSYLQLVKHSMTINDII